MLNRLSLVLMLTCVPGSQAFSAKTQNSSLNLGTLFEMAKSADPSVLKANSKISEMGETRSLARSGYFPSLAFQSTVLSNQLLFTQKFWDGGATQSASELALQEQNLAGYEKKSEIRRLYSAVSLAYYEALYAIQKTALLEKDSARSDAALAYAEKQMKYGAISKNTLLKARIAHRKAHSGLFEARNEKLKAAETLGRLTRKENFSLDSLAGKLDPNALPAVPSLSAPELFEAASQYDPTLQSLQSLEQAEVARKNLALAEDRLQVAFVASYGLGQSTPPKSIYPGYQSGVNLGAFITLPLFSGLSSIDKNRISRERLSQIHQDQSSTSSSLDFETKELLIELKQTAHDLNTLEAEVKYSEQIWKGIDTEYSVGLVTPELWFDAISSLEEWEVQQLVKTRDYMIKHETLAAALNKNLDF